MKYLKNLLRSLIYVFSLFVILTFLITIFSYFNIVGDKLVKVLKLIVPLISVFTSGIVMGRRALKKGIIEGIRLGLIIDTILIIISLFFRNLKIESLLFYFIIIITTIFGCMVGVQKKVKN